jgi:hypothetical protein
MRYSVNWYCYCQIGRRYNSRTSRILLFFEDFTIIYIEIFAEIFKKILQIWLLPWLAPSYINVFLCEKWICSNITFYIFATL